MWLPVSLVSLLLSALALRLIGGVTESLRVDSWGAASSAALVIVLFGWALGWLMMTTLGEPPDELTGLWLYVAAVGQWQYLVYHAVINAAGLALSAVVLPGVTIRGFVGPTLAVAVLTFLDLSMMRFMTQLNS